MMFEREDILPVILALGVAMLISFIATPLVKKLAYKSRCGGRAQG